MMSASCTGSSQCLELWTRGSPLNTVWRVAFNKKKKTRKECAKINIPETCNLILTESLSLQIISSLLLGVTRIHDKQNLFLSQDCQSLMNLFKSVTMNKDVCTARPDAITLPQGKFDTSFSSNSGLDLSAAYFNTSSMMGEEFFHYSLSEFMSSLVPGSVPTSPEPKFRAKEKDITLPDIQIVPGASLLEQLAEDQYFGDEQLGFVVPDNDITGSSTPQSRLADPADTSNDQVLLLDNEGDGGINEHSLNGPSFGGGFSFSGGYGSAGGDSGDSCVPQLDSSANSSNTSFDVSGASPIQASDNTSKGFEPSTSTFVLAPLGESDVGTTGSRFKKSKKKKQAVFDTDLCLPDMERDVDDIERLKIYKTRPGPKSQTMKRQKTKDLMSHDSICFSQDKRNSVSKRSTRTKQNVYVLSEFVKKMFSDIELSRPLGPDDDMNRSESPLVPTSGDSSTYNTMTSTRNQTQLMELTCMQSGMDSDLEHHRQGPSSFDEQSGQASGLIRSSSNLGGDSIKSSLSLQGLSMRPKDRPIAENGPTRGLSPIMDVESEMEEDDSIGMDGCNYGDSSIELPRCDPLSTSGNVLNESRVQTFSKHVDGVMNQREHVEFKDVLPGNGACDRKTAAKAFSKLLGVLSSSRSYKVQQDEPYGPIVITRVED